MAGENQEEREGAPDEFFSKTPFDRIKIVVAGPFMNFLLAYMLTLAMFAIGIRLPDYSNRISNVSEILKTVGLRPGDEIIEIEGQNVSSWQTMIVLIEKLAGEKENCTVTVLREGERIRMEEVKILELVQASPLIPAEVGEVIIGTPAYAAGLKAGDRIVSIDGEQTEDWSKLTAIIHASADRRLELTIDRNGRIFPIEVTPISQDMLGDSFGVIGISSPAPDYYVRRFGWKSIPYALDSTIRQIAVSYKMLWFIATHPAKSRKLVGGPILIVQMAGAEVKKGLGYFLGFMSSINIMLAIINLLPFPVLDGGHVMFFLLEKLRRKPLSLKTQELLQQVGIGLLVALMVCLFANDTLRHIDRRKALRNTETHSQ